ncbi:MAG: hypothetical protein ACM3S2_21100 [Ignavibacteriales bacterium]
MRSKLFDSTKGITGIHAYTIFGKDIICPNCENNQFAQGKALLNTPGMTFFNLDWANKTAVILICSRCQSIQWFLKEPDLKPD